MNRSNGKANLFGHWSGKSARSLSARRYLIERLLIGLLADGHVLLEGVPGLAKTLSVKTLSAAIQTTFPSDPVHARPVARRRDWHADLQSRRTASSASRRARCLPT